MTADLDAYVELRQRMRDRWQTVSPTSTASLSQAVTASPTSEALIAFGRGDLPLQPSPSATVHIDEVAVDDAHAEAHQDTIAQMCGFLGRDVAVDDEELCGIAARLDVSPSLHLVYWPEKRLLKVTTQREIVAARATTRGSLIVIR